MMRARRFAGAVILCGIVEGVGSGSVPGPCEGPEAGRWESNTYRRVVDFDQLARFAIDQYGDPTACEAEVTAEFDGSEFGTLRLSFGGRATLELETQPPETSLTTLWSQAGFRDEPAARQALRAYADDVGLDIDWSTAETETEGDLRVDRNRDADMGVNATASFFYRDGRLVGLRLSLAL